MSPFFSQQDDRSWNYRTLAGRSILSNLLQPSSCKIESLVRIRVWLTRLLDAHSFPGITIRGFMLQQCSFTEVSAIICPWVCDDFRILDSNPTLFAVVIKYFCSVEPQSGCGSLKVKSDRLLTFHHFPPSLYHLSWWWQNDRFFSEVCMKNLDVVWPETSLFPQSSDTYHFKVQPSLTKDTYSIQATELSSTQSRCFPYPTS